jgi:hypothetical protein
MLDKIIFQLVMSCLVTQLLIVLYKKRKIGQFALPWYYSCTRSRFGTREIFVQSIKLQDPFILHNHIVEDDAGFHDLVQVESTPPLHRLANNGESRLQHTK